MVRLENSEETAFYNYIMDNYPDTVVQILKLDIGGGYPDRLLLLNKGRTLFLEFKRDDGSQPSKRQKIVHANLKKLGHPVRTVRTKEEALQHLEYRLNKYKVIRSK